MFQLLNFGVGWVFSKIHGTPCTCGILLVSPGYEYIKNDDLGVKFKNVQNLINVSTLKFYFKKSKGPGKSVQEGSQECQRVFMLTFPPCQRERQRPLPRNLLGRPSVSVAAAFAGWETMKTEKPVLKQPPVSIWANRRWFKDGLLWRRGPAMRRH